MVNWWGQYNYPTLQNYPINRITERARESWSRFLIDSDGHSVLIPHATSASKASSNPPLERPAAKHPGLLPLLPAGYWLPPGQLKVSQAETRPETPGPETWLASPLLHLGGQTILSPGLNSASFLANRRARKQLPELLWAEVHLCTHLTCHVLRFPGKVTKGMHVTAEMGVWAMIDSGCLDWMLEQGGFGVREYFISDPVSATSSLLSS